MRISVVCPVFNARPDELLTAVRSVLDQTADGLTELLLIDDASTSAPTVAALDQAARLDARVKLIRAQRNGGPAAARNLGLAAATGDWIGFIDSDDLWPAEKIKCARRLHAARPDCAWIVGDFAVLGLEGPEASRPGASCFDHGDQVGPPRCSPALTKSIILDGLHLGACLLRRSAIGHSRFDASLMFGEDLLFLALLSLCCCADRAPGLSYLCRRQHESMMWSQARLRSGAAGGERAGMRERRLGPFRRYYRWKLYGVYKDLAANNLLNGRTVASLRFALSALLLDPREFGDFARFVAMLRVRRYRSRLVERTRRYSRCELLVLEDIMAARPPADVAE